MLYKIAECVTEYNPIYEYLGNKMKGYRWDKEEETDIFSDLNRNCLPFKTAATATSYFRRVWIYLCRYGVLYKIIASWGNDASCFCCCHGRKNGYFNFLHPAEQEKSTTYKTSGRNSLEKKTQKLLTMINLHFEEWKMAGMPMEHL